MNDNPHKSPFKWIILITLVLLCGVAIQNWWNGGASFRKDFSHGPRFGGYGADAASRDLSRLTGFDSIVLQGTATLDITVGQAASVSLDADKAVLNSTRVTVRGDTLFIQRHGRSWFSNTDHGPLTAHITVPSLDKLNARGTSDVTIKGAAGGWSRITISGSGHVTGSGRMNAVSLTINGTGDADFSDMPVKAATVVVNGAGRVSLDVRDRLTATVNGAGDVVYSGEPPHVSSSIHGVGSIRRSGDDKHDSGQST